MGIVALPLLVAGDHLGRGRTIPPRRAQTPPVPDPNFAATVLPAPVRVRGRRPVRGRLLRGRGLGRARVRALSRRLPAAALLLRPDRRQAGPERRAGRAGHDREADAGRLHHPLRARPRARRRHGAAGRAGPPPPRHLALGAATTAAARSSPPARRRRSRRSRRATACRSRRPTSGCCSTWSTRRSSSRWRSTSPTTSTSSRRPRREELGLKPAYPVWLDVRPSGYPVFNVQRDFGGARRHVHLAEGAVRGVRPVGQEDRRPGRSPATAIGEDLQLPATGEPLGPHRARSQGGTLIGIGGHLHPGGLTNEIDLVRDGQAQTHLHRRGRLLGPATNPSKPGGPPTSWDFSMRVTGLPVLGRARRSRATSCAATRPTTRRSSRPTRTWASRSRCSRPTTPTASRPRPGVDPFTAPTRHVRRAATSGGLEAATPTLCDKGIGHPRPPTRERQLRRARAAPGTRRAGQPTNEVGIADFLYAPGDLSTISMTGVPTVKLGTTLSFTNLEGAAIYHTVTSCAFPCLGPTGAAFPLADGETSTGRQLDFDSSELGFGTPGDRPGQADAATGTCRSPRRRATSPARSSPTSAASTRSCAARSR